MTKELREKLTDLAALLTAAVALGTTIKELREALQGAGTEVWKNWPWYVVPAVIFLAMLFWRRERLVQWLNPRSTVSRRDAFHIGRKYLLGREADIERLLRALAEWPLVFLVGESGAGKSSLLERGVLPRLKETPGQFPLLINSWGPDWIEGPREALAQALEAALVEPLRKLLGIEGPVTPGDALAIVGRLRSKATRTPILLFDQVDDYQTRHRDKFLSGPDRTLLSAADLAAANSFWREVADLLKSGGARCLFTTRSDAKIGLESVRFQEPKVYPLDPLEKSAAADLLAEISRDAVDHPERGFDRLKERLLDDLAADGWVLPIQMQVAFSGLAEMRFLSVGEYERQGGLPGLEALHLESRISAAARAIGMSVSEVRTVLLSMVDRATRKTVPRATEKLSAADPSKLTDLLGKLELDEVVRRRIDPGGEGSVWLLDHDYLSRGLLELNGRAQRWPLLLEEAALSYKGARGIFDRWKKLLSPSLQFRLLYEWLRRRLKYGNAAGYARISTVRILVWLLIPLLTWFGWRAFSDQKEAERLFAELTTGELRALWNLSSKEKSVRHAFLDTAFAHVPNARRFQAHGVGALQAIIGFREEDRNYVIEKIVRGKCTLEDSAISDPVMIDVCALVIQHITVPEDDLRKILGSWLKAAKNLEALSHIKEAMASIGLHDPGLERVLSRKAFEIYEASPGHPVGAVGPLLVLEERRRMATLFLQSLRDNEPNDEILRRYRGQILGDVMTPDERREVLDRVVQSLEEFGLDTTAVEICNIVASSLSGLDVERLLPFIEGKSDLGPGALQAISSSPVLLRVLSSREARRILTIYLAEMRPFLLGPEYIDPIIDKLDSSDAVSVWKFLHDKVVAAPSSEYELYWLSLLLPVKEQLSSSGINEVSRYLLVAIQREERADDLTKLTGRLVEFGEDVPRDVAQRAYVTVWVKLNNMKLDKDKRWEMKIFTARLSSDPVVVDAAVGSLLARERASSQGPSGWNMLTLSDFSEQMSDGRVRETVAAFIRGLVESTEWNASDVFYFGEKFESRLEPEERQRIIRTLLNHADRSGYELHYILEAFDLLGKDASPELTLRVLQEWSDISRLTTSPNCSAIAPLILDPRDPLVIDLLKWPTCPNGSRDVLIKRLDDLVPDGSFGSKDSNGRYRADIWGKFLPWAKKQGLDIESPPALPDLDRLNAKGING